MVSKNIVMLDSVKHSKLKVNTTRYNCSHNHVNVASVIVNELSTLVHEYPIFMTKNSATGDFQLSAILGFSNGENLFIHEDTWQASYLPLDILRRPFQLISPKEGANVEGHLAIDTSSPQLQDKMGEALFDDKGQSTPYLQRIQQTFSQLVKGTEQTKNMLKQADTLGLIEPITLNIELNDQDKISLTGLYGINQKAVTELSGKALTSCHKEGILQVCHLLLSSGIHLDKLIKWKNSKG